jgi:DNA-binding ferritin-like protein (Dps family)
MKFEITDNDRMLQIIQKLVDFNEQIKVYGSMAEVFEDDLSPFVPRILKNLEKIIVSEGTTRLHGAISETVGNIVFFMIEKISGEHEKRDFFEAQVLAFIFRIIEKSSNKLV